MRFSVIQSGCASERLANLKGFRKNPDTRIETPTSALFTQSGSVVHLTAEMLDKVFPNTKLLWVPLSKSIHLETGTKALGQGVASFAGLAKHAVCTTLHNISAITPLGHFEPNKVPLWTKHGKKMISADRYMDVMEIFKPDLILAIADGHLSNNEGYKRICKSQDRTYSMLDVCVRRHKASMVLKDSALIGIIVGTGNEKKWDECMQYILRHKDSLSGIALQGITYGMEESMSELDEKLAAIFKRINDTLPKDMLRILEGCWNPAMVVTAIEHGWDLFDGAYPLKLTNSGNALALNFDISRYSNELCILDLNDIGYKEDFRPILENCTCLACQKHTRAYIRHLLNTREMLASVLLSIHNLHHFDQLFLHARLHIASKTYSVYKDHIIKQYAQYQKSKIIKSTNENEVNSDGQIKKKVCVSDVNINRTLVV